MKTEKKTIEKDGITYILEPVKSGGRTVGIAPIRKMEDLDEMLAVIEPEATFKLAYRQYTQDLMNRLRALVTSKEISYKMIVEAIAAEKLSTDQISELMKKQPDLSFEAAARMLLKTVKSEPDEIHWELAD